MIHYINGGIKMKNKILNSVLIVLILLFSLRNSHAFDKIYGEREADEALSIQQLENNEYIAVGYKRSLNRRDKNIWILKFNKDGEKIWDKSVFGMTDDAGHSIQVTGDKNYIVTGYTESKGQGAGDVWVLKFDKNGERIWEKTFGGSSLDTGEAVLQTKDKGYIVVGNTESKGAGLSDIWVLKLDKDGNLLWDKTFGGEKPDRAKSIQITEDSGYIIAGTTESKGAGASDIWVLKLDKHGTLLWDKTYGGEQSETANSILQTKDKGYIIAGRTSSKGAGKSDIWVMKLNKDGGLEWDKTFGGTEEEEGNFIVQTKDKGYIIAGRRTKTTRIEALILKLDKDGNVAWEKDFTENHKNIINAIQQTKDKGYICAGGKQPQNSNNIDLWILKLDKNGDIE